MSKTGVSKLWPMGQFHWQPVFVTKVLLEQNHTCLFMHCLWLLLCYNGSTEWRCRPCGPQSMRHSLFSPSTEKFADPCHGTSMHIQTTPSEWRLWQSNNHKSANDFNTLDISNIEASYRFISCLWDICIKHVVSFNFFLIYKTS